MNIFATSDNPFTSAAFLDDKRINKMITETQQMLSCALGQGQQVIMKSDGVNFMKQTHRHHPCTVWTGADTRNFHWLVQHLQRSL